MSASPLAYSIFVGRGGRADPCHTLSSTLSGTLIAEEGIAIAEECIAIKVFQVWYDSRIDSRQFA